MIKNERQYKITKAQAVRFSNNLESLRQRPKDENSLHPLVAKAQEDALSSQLADLESELSEYESLKEGEFQWDSLNIVADLPFILIKAGPRDRPKLLEYHLEGLGALAERSVHSPPQWPDVRTVLEGSNGPVAGGIVIPFVQAQVPNWVPSGRATTMLSRVGLKSFVSWTLAPATVHAQGSARRVDQDALLAPSFAPVGGVASNGAPPKRALPMEQSADCHSQSTPPNSSDSPPPEQPRCPPALQAPPSAGGPVDSAVVSQFPGQTVPLAATAHRKMMPSSISHRRVCAPYPGAGPTI